MLRQEPSAVNRRRVDFSAVDRAPASIARDEPITLRCWICRSKCFIHLLERWPSRALPIPGTTVSALRRHALANSLGYAAACINYTTTEREFDATRHHPPSWRRL